MQGGEGGGAPLNLLLSLSSSQPLKADGSDWTEKGELVAGWGGGSSQPLALALALPLYVSH